MTLKIWALFAAMILTYLSNGTAFAGSITLDATGFGVDPCYQQCASDLSTIHPQSRAKRVFKSCMAICQAGGTSGDDTTATPAPAPAAAFGPDTCSAGFVWREAIPSDHVCVTPQSRRAVRTENANYRSLIDVNGASGSNSCISGYVWREAFSGDAVCVTPGRRAAVRQENADAPSHVAG